MTLTAEGCVAISSSQNYLTVSKNGCGQNLGSIAGVIRNVNGDGIAGVEITLNTGAKRTTTSDGTYSFEDLPLGVPYTLTPSKTDGSSNGVSAQDMVIIINHILGTNTLDNVFQIIASDTNGDNRVSSIDLVNMLNVILGKRDEFTGEKSWRFIPSDHQLDMNDPFSFLEKRAVENLSGDVMGVNFTGQKVGDVSGNASTN